MSKTNQTVKPSRIIRLQEVIHRVGFCRSSIYQKMKDGSFPSSIHLGSRAIGFKESDIDAYIDSLSYKSAPAKMVLQ